MKKTGGAATGVNAYNQVSVQAGVADASPHRLIQMLIDAALKKIHLAKGNIENNDIAKKGELIGQVISIVDCLRASLDHSQGGDISSNLELLYEYMIRRLTEANIKNDLGALDEVIELLKPIKEAWDAIPEEIRQQHQEFVASQDKQAAEAG